MAKIKVLIVDDSAAIRRVLMMAFQGTTDLLVVGAVADGRKALDQLAALRPDVMVLDLEMPVLDGAATLVELRKTHGRQQLPVIIFSTLIKGSKEALRLLYEGANDYVCKPSQLQADAAIKQIQDELIPKIRHLAPRAS